MEKEIDVDIGLNHPILISKSKNLIILQSQRSAAASLFIFAKKIELENLLDSKTIIISPLDPLSQ